MEEKEQFSQSAAPTAAAAAPVTGADTQPASRPVRYQRIVFVAAFSAFLATFNETFLNVSFAFVMKDFGVSVGTVQWLATAYMLGAAVMVPVSAFLYRSIKTRPLYLFTVGLLIAGSVIGALSQNFTVLLIGRIVQALGTGMLIPIGMNITLEVAPKQKLGTYMGIMGAMTTLGPSSSVIVAGVLLEFFSWHFLLWFFGALSLVCFLCGAALLTNVAHLSYPKLDILSVILISLALIGILYGVSTIFAGSLPVALAAAVIGILCLTFFVKRQNQLQDPLIQLQPLRIRAFSVGVIINMISLLVIFAMNIVMPLFMQGGMSMSAFGASMVLFPAILLSCVISPLAGRIYDRRGGKVLLPLGFACIGVCTLALGFAHVLALPVLLAILYIPVICGSALIIGPVQSFALSHLTPEQNPHGVTVMSTGFQIAGCIGSSLFTGVFGLYTAPGSGFTAVCLLAAVFAVVGFVLAFTITRARKAAGASVTAASEGKITAGLTEASAAGTSASLAAGRKKAVSRVLETAASSNSPIASIMKESVFSVSDHATLLDTLRCMAENKVSGLPVVDDENRVVGFIADGDISYIFQKDSNQIGFASMYPLWQDPKKFDDKIRELAHISVMDCATTRVVSVDVTDQIDVLFKAFSDKRIKKVPVLSEGKMVGIISRSDLFRQLIAEM